MVHKETAVLGNVMSVTLVHWTEFQQNHDENRSSRSSKMLISSLPVIWCHSPEDSTHQRVTICTLPSWCSSYIPKGLVQVKFSVSWTSVNIWSTIQVYTRQVSRNSCSNTLEPTQSQHDHPAACVIDQRYSSATWVLLCLLLKKLLFFCFTFLKLNKLGECLYSYNHTFIICLRVCIMMPRNFSLSVLITMQYTNNMSHSKLLTLSFTNLNLHHHCNCSHCCSAFEMASSLNLHLQAEETQLLYYNHNHNCH